MKKALLLTLGLLVAFELIVRFVLFPASGDFVRFGTYDAQASALTQADALRIAIVGNSAAEEGIDRPRLESLLAQRLGKPVRVELFFADGSEIVTWHAMLDHYFWNTGAKADVYVLNFFGTLADTPRFEFIRVGMFFAKLNEWPYYINQQLQTLSQRIDFALSSTWATFGARDRIRDRALDVVIPGYRDLLGRLNRTPIGADEPVTQPQDKRFTALDRTLAKATQHNARIVLTAFPLRTGRYVIDSEIEERARRGEFGLVDLRSTSTLTPTDYRDDIHLLARGRGVFTAQLANELAQALGESH